MTSEPSSTQERIAQARQWLAGSVFPLWKDKGIDKDTGSFAESISFTGQASFTSQRALVQARQIYSFAEACRLGILPANEANKIVFQAGESFIEKYAQDFGGFVHAVNPQGQVQNPDLDLYTQAFALFGLAQAHSLVPNEKFKVAAFRLLSYLKTDRQNPNGGYSEIKDGNFLYQSNPHMHLFEAALAWMEVDFHSRWRELADELYNLCLQKFIDAESGALCEHFTATWQPLREDGRFFFEPGHHYEWSWLFLEYQRLTGIDCLKPAEKLFAVAERYGVNPDYRVIDEVWSDFQVKKQSSRFWPQCERIKAAVSLGLLHAEQSMQAETLAKAADQALDVLTTYFTTPLIGLWWDRFLDGGFHKESSAKASSLYHIINALSQYFSKRPKI